MSDMIDFSGALLTQISVFVGSEPIIYLFGTIIFCFVAKLVVGLIWHR